MLTGLMRLTKEQHSLYKEITDLAKQKHKEEIVDAWNDGDYAYFHSKETGRDFEDGEQYYKEKYER